MLAIVLHTQGEDCAGMQVVHTFCIGGDVAVVLVEVELVGVFLGRVDMGEDSDT